VFTTLGSRTSHNDPAMAITTRSGTTTRDLPYPASHTSPLLHEHGSNDEIRSKEPQSILKQKKDEDEKLLNIFKQIHINLPFLEAMINMPKGAKVLKDLLSHKDNSKKQLHLGASINLKPYSLYSKLRIYELKPTKMIIQLADCSPEYPIDAKMMQRNKPGLELGEVPFHGTSNDQTRLVITFRNYVDASDYAVRTMLGQRIKNHFHPSTMPTKL
nr:hypothetical protein [Tanacetum cinerariifolium]